MEIKNEGSETLTFFSAGSQPLVGVSLDSVVQKANKLACILQSCKHSLENQPSPLSWGRDSNMVPGLPSRQRTESATSVGSTGSRPHTIRVSNEAVVEQWQHLTSYIVSLEKEVQCYKQLLEECQQVQTTHSEEDLDILLDTEHAQNGSQHMQTTFGRRTRRRSSLPDQQCWNRLLEDDMSHALLLVFQHLSTQELCAVFRVCKKWNAIAKHPKLWRTVIFSETMLHPQVVLRISRMCKITEKLTLHGLMPPMTEHDENLTSYIGRTRGSLEEAIEAILSNSDQSLLSVSLTECNLMITDRILWLLSIYCPNLKSFSYSSDEFPPSAESLWSMINGCKCLQHLHLPPVLGSPNQECFNDDALRVIAIGWPNLVSLTVGGKTITNQGLAEIANGCPNLCFLEIIHGPGLDKNAAELLCGGNGLSSLTTLVLNFTPSTHIAMSHLLNCCTRLQRLDLHITLQTYFSSNEASIRENMSAYEQIVRNLKKLEKQKKGKNVFHLFEHYSRV